MSSSSYFFLIDFENFLKIIQDMQISEKSQGHGNGDFENSVFQQLMGIGFEF